MKFGVFHVVCMQVLLIFTMFSVKSKANQVQVLIQFHEFFRQIKCRSSCSIQFYESFVKSNADQVAVFNFTKFFLSQMQIKFYRVIHLKKNKSNEL